MCFDPGTVNCYASSIAEPSDGGPQLPALQGRIVIAA